MIQPLAKTQPVPFEHRLVKGELPFATIEPVLADPVLSGRAGSGVQAHSGPTEEVAEIIYSPTERWVAAEMTEAVRNVPSGRTVKVHGAFRVSA